MPGPSNGKRRNKHKGKICKRPREPVQIPEPTHSNQSSAPSSPTVKTPAPTQLDYFTDTKKEATEGDHVPTGTIEKIEEILFQEPFIYDPGNGPRVRSARAFMASFFAKPPALDDPLCAEFAQEEVLQMLCTVLAEETALILWYNKSRSESRICPSCQRLYQIGDALPDLITDDHLPPPPHSPPSPRLLQEQRISGLCSPVCFIVASFNRPGAIKAAWGRMGDEMDDDTWQLLSGPSEDIAKNDLSSSLGMLVRMTRLHDLGLAQLCFDPEETALLQAAAELDVDVVTAIIP